MTEPQGIALFLILVVVTLVLAWTSFQPHAEEDE